MNGILKRLFETFISCFIASVPFTSLILYELLDSTKFNCYIIMFLSALAFLILNIYFLRAYFVFSRNIKLYFIVNYSAYAIFAVISMAALLTCYYLDLPAVYTLLFLPLKVFMIFYKNSIISAIIYHLIIIAVIYIAPLTTNNEMLWEMDEIDERIVSEDMEYLSKK